MNLKNIKLFNVLALLFVATITGCYKDDSNNDIRPVNNIALSDPKAGAQLVVYQGDSLKLKPALTQTMKDNLGQLEFTWIVYNSNGAVSLAAPRVELSKSYELKYLVKGDPFILGEPYVVRIAVKDKETGVTSYLNYNILIGNKYGTGWMTLEDKSGKGDLSFIFPDYTAEHGIYTDRNTAVITGPKKLEITPYPVSEDISPTGKRIYILAENGSQEYNYLTMVKKFDFSFEFFNAPSVQKPVVMTWLSQYVYSGVRSASLGIVINDGKLHSNLVGGFPGVKKWGAVALNPAGNLNYSLAPFAVGGESYPAVVYDNLSKRFYHIVAYNPTAVAGSLQAFPSGSTSSVSTVFDMNNVGMTMAFQDSSEVMNEYNAVMKSDDNQPYLLRYKTKNTVSAPNLTLEKKLMNAPGILNHTAAAGSTSTPHLYYGVGNIISRYETSSNLVVETYNLPAGENVTAMKYAKYSSDRTGPKLAVATWNGTEGKVYYFNINNVGSIGAYTHVVTGFAKIVDLVYKY